MEIFLSEDQIQAAIKDLVFPVSFWKPDIILCTLSGAVPFFNDLTKHLVHDFEVDFIKTKTYSSNGVIDKTSIQAGPFLDVRGKRVMIIEDIIDSGTTIKAIVEDLSWRGCDDVAVACLLKRKSFINTLMHNDKPLPLAFGLEVDEGLWLVGYGMDDEGKQRQLRDIYVKR